MTRSVVNTINTAVRQNLEFDISYFHTKYSTTSLRSVKITESASILVCMQLKDESASSFRIAGIRTVLLPFHGASFQETGIKPSKRVLPQTCRVFITQPQPQICKRFCKFYLVQNCGIFMYSTYVHTYTQWVYGFWRMRSETFPLLDS